MDRALMQRALDALENVCLDSDRVSKEDSLLHISAIADLRAALAVPSATGKFRRVVFPVSVAGDDAGVYYRADEVEAALAVGDKPAMSEHVPGVCVDINGWPMLVGKGSERLGGRRPLYTSPPDVPPGFVLVPIEPTSAMIDAACEATADSIDGRPVWKLTIDVQKAHAYRAMIKAAPKVTP